MIKIIKKIFTEPENIQDSRVEIEVDIPAKTRKDAFDEAVKEVVAKKLRETVIEELAKECYDVDVWEQTQEVIEKYGEYPIPESNRDYPKANKSRQHVEFLVYDCPFDLDLFVDRLIKKELDNEKD